ncbi:MAG: DUF4340 domain-containing protein [Chitinophagaceae bacterium]|nr:DUF4340 domain-containing protein [Chitinophagaceae bacterium]MCB9046968.1 DUF4340 domain-containing protein [Chitinophagales bacterium]
MRKTIIYIAILGILGFGVWYFLFKDNNIFGEKEAGFTIVDTSDVYKIFLADQSGHTISLRRGNNGWLVNDTYKASKRMTDNLLSTFHEQFAAYPVPENAHNHVIKSLAGSAVKAQVFNKNGKMISTFYVGGQATNNTGTYMLMEGARRPYVVQLPAYTGYLTPRYSVNLKEWRDRTAINIAPESLRSVEIKYLTESEYLNSFSMTRSTDGTFTVQLHPELSIRGEQNKKRMSAYSGFFQQVGFEGFLAGVTGLDSIIASATKRCEISVEDMNGQDTKIDVYWMPVNKRSKNLATSSPGTPDEYDADRFYGVINDYKDTVILQSQTFDKILRKGYEFYEDDQE